MFFIGGEQGVIGRCSIRKCWFGGSIAVIILRCLASRRTARTRPISRLLLKRQCDFGNGIRRSRLWFLLWEKKPSKERVKHYRIPKKAKKICVRLKNVSQNRPYGRAKGIVTAIYKFGLWEVTAASDITWPPWPNPFTWPTLLASTKRWSLDTRPPMPLPVQILMNLWRVVLDEKVQVSCGSGKHLHPNAELFEPQTHR